MTKPKNVKIRVLRAAWVMIFGNWSEKISVSKNAERSRPQSTRTASQASRPIVAA